MKICRNLFSTIVDILVSGSKNVCGPIQFLCTWYVTHCTIVTYDDASTQSSWEDKRRVITGAV